MRLAIAFLLCLSIFCVGERAPMPAELAPIEEIVFAARPYGADGHWYANFGYYSIDDSMKAYSVGGRLCKYNLKTGKFTQLLIDKEGGVRDPAVHYDGKRIVFSYRKGGTDNYHLYMINADGSDLRQLTDGKYDDIEASFLPDGGIAFVSSRCKRWVNCWVTQVAVVHRCDIDGSNIRPLSSNGEQDNTPWMLPDGRLLYTRWEYTDRSQVDYHHLWTMNPDGTGQMVYYGNYHPGKLMIDAKPIPDSEKVVAIFSPGHGRKSHQGNVAILSPKTGPDDLGAVREITKTPFFRDPYALSENCILAATGQNMVVLDGEGAATQLFRLPKALLEQQYALHEPRPIIKRPPERLMPERTQWDTSTGTLVLSNIYEGRAMEGVAVGDIKKLLVLEVLPMPVHFHGGMTPITIGGSFTLERVMGTVPVEADGSAYVELPGLRSFFFVALDENNESVKRMQSWLTVMPGEQVSCVGCHEPRTQSPQNSVKSNLLALQRPPSKIKKLEGIPEVYDFPRDIQPILDQHCLPCHDQDERKAGVVLSGDRGPVYTHSFVTLTGRQQFSDGRNQKISNRPPRSIGAVVSPIMKKVQEGHQGVEMSAHEQDLIRYWIEAGATYPGTYAAIDSGMLGWYFITPPDSNAKKDVRDQEWPTSKAAFTAMKKRCVPCHNQETKRFLPRFLSAGPDGGRYSRHLLYNLSQPEKSQLLRAPLAKEAGGYGICRNLNGKNKATDPAQVFADTNDPDYQSMLAMIEAGHDFIQRETWFRMADFKPSAVYIREMKRYGMLDEKVQAGDVLNPYTTDQAYWQSFWWPPGQ
jgi:hypothetical protein